MTRKKTGKLALLTNDKMKLSKAEIKRRIKAEERIKVNSKEFIITENVLKNEKAVKKWRELVELYRQIDVICDIDAGTLEKYCITYGEYLELLNCKIKLRNQYPDDIDYLQSLNELKLHNEINKKLDLLIKMEDRLFLNPVSRMKAIPPKPEPKKESLLESMGFGNI